MLDAVCERGLGTWKDASQLVPGEEVELRGAMCQERVMCEAGC